MNLTTTQLRYLSRQIAAGRPLWALLILNEYTTLDDPIRSAYAHKAVGALARNGKTPVVIQDAILKGKRLGELAKDTAELLRTCERQEGGTSPYSTQLSPFRLSRTQPRERDGVLSIGAQRRPPKERAYDTTRRTSTSYRLLHLTPKSKAL